MAAEKTPYTVTNRLTNKLPEVPQAELADGEDLIVIEQLVPFENHPFKVDTESEDYLQLLESIRTQGQLEPILIRLYKNDTYQIISGHRRVAACMELGLEHVRAIVRPIKDDDEAVIAMVHSNFHRSVISTSEKTKAYRMWHDAEKHQGKRGDTAALIGAENDETGRNVKRYVRLSYLTDDLLQSVDDKSITMVAGVDLSYLNDVTQRLVYDISSRCGIEVTAEIAAKLRGMFEASGETTLNEDAIKSVFLDCTGKKATKGGVSIKQKDLTPYFEPDTSREAMTSVIFKLLDGWRDGRFELGEDGDR